jgi:hypothetical protein
LSRGKSHGLLMFPTGIPRVFSGNRPAGRSAIIPIWPEIIVYRQPVAGWEAGAVFGTAAYPKYMEADQED